MNKFDYEILKRQIIKCYSELKDPVWAAEDYFIVIKCFLMNYEKHKRRQHYRLSNYNLLRVMDALADFSPEDYISGGMIERYFKTTFNPGCDYSIFHFLSVREFRFYESYY